MSDDGTDITDYIQSYLLAGCQWGEGGGGCKANTLVQGVRRRILTVTVSPEPTFITDSGSLLIICLKSLTSLRFHIDAAEMGGKSSTTTNTTRQHLVPPTDRNPHQLTVAVAREPILMTFSGFFFTMSLNPRVSFLVQIEAGISGGIRTKAPTTNRQVFLFIVSGHFDFFRWFFFSNLFWSEKLTPISCCNTLEMPQNSVP